MTQEVEDVSIERIQFAMPQMKGIEKHLIVDYSEHTLPNENRLIHRFPIRLEGMFIFLREKGRAKANINLKDYEVGPNDLIICSSGDIIQTEAYEGVHLSQTLMASSAFLKEMYISLNSFMPFFASQKDHPVFHLTDEEVEELKSYFLLIENVVSHDDYFKVDTTKRLLAAYLYKLGSILYRHRPELQAEAAKPLKREEILFKEFIQLVGTHHRKERRVDFYAEQMFLSPKHFSTVVKKVSGKTAGQWIDEYVILEAKTLLKYSAMSIQEIAYYMNFSNPSFFGKYFKHHTSMSPSEYKAQI